MVQWSPEVSAFHAAALPALGCPVQSSRIGGTDHWRRTMVVSSAVRATSGMTWLALESPAIKHSGRMGGARTAAGPGIAGGTG
jgi:hypothetical protein